MLDQAYHITASNWKWWYDLFAWYPSNQLLPFPVYAFIRVFCCFFFFFCLFFFIFVGCLYLLWKWNREMLIVQSSIITLIQNTSFLTRRVSTYFSHHKRIAKSNMKLPPQLVSVLYILGFTKHNIPTLGGWQFKWPSLQKLLRICCFWVCC